MTHEILIWILEFKNLRTYIRDGLKVKWRKGIDYNTLYTLVRSEFGLGACVEIFYYQENIVLDALDFSINSAALGWFKSLLCIFVFVSIRKGESEIFLREPGEVGERRW